MSEWTHVCMVGACVTMCTCRDWGRWVMSVGFGHLTAVAAETECRWKLPPIYLSVFC